MWRWRRKQLPFIIFLAICFNIVLSPLVYASTSQLEARHTYALVGLGIITLGIILYLFDVIFRPERY
ncbi:MAG: potassium-transporting ATPase subunit F [Calothrix sp. C42_A2020_038]|nr:potassium-transporting ATPase subunit F [Calothrix sp. C42_A2020_038]